MEKHSYSTHPPRKKERLTAFSTTVKSMEKHSYFVSLPNQKEREDALLHEEDNESLTQEGRHECLEEVEEENKCQEAEDVDQEVEDKDKEQGGVEIVHFASSEATPPKLPSELHFKWFKGCNGLLHKLHNNKAKIGWANRVWDPGKSSMDHYWEVTHCMGALRSLNLPGHTNFKYWWGFKDEFKHKPP
ncbi:hypothetical protein PIB30_029359 [Stylosanthes scabra]|uniref:Uncharacterized protein n=1 Tax=Stylosanthes scabra TaxID=79078 RepID=A0ABU6SBC2_9FABA|nr:hypothetical protein [Stylosanthes scabra]